MNIKRCPTCGDRPVIDFPKNMRKNGGLDTYCKKCRKLRSDKYCLLHPTKAAENSRIYRLNKSKLVGSGSKFLRWLKANNFPSGFRVLCHNCNLAIGLYSQCPH